MDGLLIDDTGAILRLTLNRPDKFNALTADLIHAVADQIDQTSARVVVLTGNGKAFCSGADVSGDKPSMDTLHAANRLTLTILDSPKPVVAAVNGIAAGVGVSFALACDLQVVKASAAFMLAFTKIGLMPDGGASLLVPAAVGRARAARMALLAEKIPAAQAGHFGGAFWQNPLHQSPILFGELEQGPRVAVVLAGAAGREGNQLQAQIGVEHLAAVAELLGHALGQVDRNRKTQASARSGTHQGVDTNHLAASVDQGTAGITRVDRRIGLDQIKPLVGKAQAVDIAVQAADDAKGHGALQAIGTPHGNSPISHLKGFGIPQGGCLEPGGGLEPYYR